MRILTRYILREILRHALLGLLLFTFVLFAQNVIGKLLDLLVRSSAPPRTVAWLFTLTLPAALTLTIPMAVLVGILIGLSRMASDGEVTATRAAGLSVYHYLVPVLGFALAGVVLSAFVSVYLAPRAMRELVRMKNVLAASVVSSDVQPRVFQEDFGQNLVLYVDDVRGDGNEWRGVFIADPTAPTAPKVTFAERAIVLPRAAGGHIQVHLINGSSHEVKPNQEEYLISRFSQSDIPITLPTPPETSARSLAERYTSELLALPFGHPERQAARIELHRRLALPIACLVLAMVGIPLGLSARRGGKSGGVIVTVLLVFGYYVLFFSGIRLANQDRLRPGQAVWMADAVFFILGLVMLFRVDRGLLVTNWMHQARIYLETHVRRLGRNWKSDATLTRRWFNLSFTRILDGYLLRGFVSYFVVVLVSFVMLAEIVTFLDLLNDIYRNRVSWGTIGSYFFYLAPQLTYAVAPISVLVAVLVSFGLLTKRNEFTALKACGISLYRASIPIFLLATLLSGGLFAFDHFTLPASNKKQEALRNQIKGRPAQTYLQPDRKWIKGQQSRIFYYSFFDPADNVMGGVSVFEFDPRTYQLRRRISAERVNWEPAVGNWVFTNGWYRDIDGINVTDYQKFQVHTFPEITERDTYFKKDVKQAIEMNFQELKRYMDDLQQSGFDTVKLRVQFYKKFAFPLFALIMALLAVPFSFSIGQRGALAGAAVSIGIAILYWTLSILFEQMGNISQLPAPLAAWSPDILFGLIGVYMLLRVKT